MQVAPAAARTGEVTRLLRAARDGDAGAIDRIVPLVYEDLRRLARRQLGRGFDPQTVRPTELVHEAYVKLSIGGAEAAGSVRRSPALTGSPTMTPTSCLR